MLNTLRRWAMIPMLPAMVFMMPPARAPAPWELPNEIQAQLVADVRIKLLQHYQTEAIAEADGRFDFRSCKHAAIAGGLVQVRGDFLLSEQTAAAHTGSVEVFYAANDSGWSVLERYCVEERSVPLHTLVVQVRDGLSGEPLAGATVVARSGLRQPRAHQRAGRGTTGFATRDLPDLRQPTPATTAESRRTSRCAPRSRQKIYSWCRSPRRKKATGARG